MAVIRNTASAMANGRIGNTTYYVANGQQIARQANNNSNYGSGASRTDAQQTRRVKWANLVNAYKAMEAWMKKAYESKSANQSDYNKFMQLNINTSSVALTKDMAANGCAVFESWTISQGSVLPVKLIAESLNIGVVTDIALSAAISANTTIAALSADIIANNPGYRNGDNIAQIFFTNVLDSRGYPYADTLYYEFTLDTSNTALLSTLAVNDVMDSSVTGGGYHLATKQSWVAGKGIVGYAWIHTRKVDGKLQVSTQDIFMEVTTYDDQFSSDEAVAAAIASYGVEEEVPLDPSFLKASGVRVSANGVDLIGGMGRTYQVSGAQTVVVTGRHMTAQNVQLYHDGELYTPLAVDGNSWTYILGDNGNNRIMVNGNLLLAVEVSDIQVPASLPTYMRSRLYVGASDFRDDVVEERVDCLNYPYKVTETYQQVRLDIGSEDASWEDVTLEDLTGVNCAIRETTVQQTYRKAFLITPTDASKPAYVMLDGFIFYVFNY